MTQKIFDKIAGNKMKKGKGDPLINKLEEIFYGNEYPLALISTILLEKNISYNFGIKKAHQKLKIKVESLLVDYGTLEKYENLSKEEVLKEIYKKLS